MLAPLPHLPPVAARRPNTSTRRVALCALPRLDGPSLRGALGATPGAALPTIGSTLNWLQANFAGYQREGERRGPAAAVYSLLLRFSRFASEPSLNDPAELAVASERASLEDRSQASMVWEGRDEAELGATLSLGITVLAREAGWERVSGSGGAGALSDELLAGTVSRRVASLIDCLGVSATAASLAVRKQPALLTVGPSEVAARLLLLRRAAPRADLARMILQCPRALACPEHHAEAWGKSLLVLRGALPLCEWVDFLAQEDAELLFADFSDGLAQLTQLWGDEDLATSAYLSFRRDSWRSAPFLLTHRSCGGVLSQWRRRRRRSRFARSAACRAGARARVSAGRARKGPAGCERWQFMWKSSVGCNIEQALERRAFFRMMALPSGPHRCIRSSCIHIRLRTGASSAAAPAAAGCWPPPGSTARRARCPAACAAAPPSPAAPPVGKTWR